MTGLNDVKQAAVRARARIPRPIRRGASQVWVVINRTDDICLRYQITGLA